MSRFCYDQTRTRVCSPRIAGQVGVRMYAAAVNPRPPPREPAPRRENTEQEKGGHLWMDTI
jgi:hypothetical protein